MPRGRPAKYPSQVEARRVANHRAAERAREKGLVQRSLTLPIDCWALIRAARGPSETSDSQTVARLLRAADLAEGRSANCCHNVLITTQ
jgi:hypothetical protein